MSTIRSGARVRSGILRRAAARAAAIFWAPLSAASNLPVWHERARQRAALSTLDDRLLRDIGVDRASAQHEAERPFWER
ncbi:MAG: DUF1127 domain-containing protein [Rhodospirillales bacterium]|jgi:uncharacterized protein YjiS (DUF1127 family)